MVMPVDSRLSVIRASSDGLSENTDDISLQPLTLAVYICSH